MWLTYHISNSYLWGQANLRATGLCGYIQFFHSKMVLYLLGPHKIPVIYVCIYLFCVFICHLGTSVDMYPKNLERVLDSLELEL